MDLTKFSLNDLNFELNKAEEELKSIPIETFTFNPRIIELSEQISEIKKAIQAKEEKRHE